VCNGAQHGTAVKSGCGVTSKAGIPMHSNIEKQHKLDQTIQHTDPLSEGSHRCYVSVHR
jgi:hypothetical protein